MGRSRNAKHISVSYRTYCEVKRMAAREGIPMAKLVERWVAEHCPPVTRDRPSERFGAVWIF